MMQQEQHGAPRWRMVGLALLLLGVVSCAARTPPPAPPASTANLYVVRTAADGLAEFIPIAIDTGLLVPLTPQTYVEVALAPGLHKVISFLGDYEVTLLLIISPDQPTFIRLTHLGGAQ